MLHGAVADGDGNGAQDVARALGPYVVHVAELLAAQVAHVEALEGHEKEQIMPQVLSNVRTVQETL